MSDDPKAGKMLESCFHKGNETNMITIIRTAPGDGGLKSLRRISVSVHKTVLFAMGEDNKMRKVKILEELKLIEYELGHGMKTFTVRCNGMLVSDSVLNVVNQIKIMITTRQQLSKSKSSSKARKRKRLAGQILDLIETAEKRGEKIAGKDKMQELVERGGEMTPAEEEDDEIKEMLERRFAEKKALDRGSFGTLVEDPPKTEELS